MALTSEAFPTMSQPEFRFRAGEDRQAILTPGLRLTFLHLGDRWSHALAIGDGGPEQLVGIAETVEGDPERDDPARVVSPVFQEVQPHVVEGDVCALLTGHSSPHHFSAVVTARRDGRSVVIEVDLADRCRGIVEALAATYLVQLGSSDLIDAGPERIIWEGSSLGGGRLEFIAKGGDGVALAEAGRRASRVQAMARLVPSTFTQRLCYRWRWTPADGS